MMYSTLTTAADSTLLSTTVPCVCPPPLPPAALGGNFVFSAHAAPFKPTLSVFRHDPYHSAVIPESYLLVHCPTTTTAAPARPTSASSSSRECGGLSSSDAPSTRNSPASASVSISATGSELVALPSATTTATAFPQEEEERSSSSAMVFPMQPLSSTKGPQQLSWSDVLEEAEAGLGIMVPLLTNLQRSKLLETLRWNPYHGSGSAPCYDSMAALCAVADVASTVLSFLPRRDLWRARLVSSPAMASVNHFISEEMVDLVLRPYQGGAQCLTVVNIHDCLNPVEGGRGRIRRTPQVLIRQAIVVTRAVPSAEFPAVRHDQHLSQGNKNDLSLVESRGRAALACRIFDGISQKDNPNAFHCQFRLVLWPRSCSLLKLLKQWSLGEEEEVGSVEGEVEKEKEVAQLKDPVILSLWNPARVCAQLKRRYALFSPSNAFAVLQNVAQLVSGGVSVDRKKATEFHSYFSSAELDSVVTRVKCFTAPTGEYLCEGMAEQSIEGSFPRHPQTRHLSLTVNKPSVLQLVGCPTLRTWTMDAFEGDHDEATNEEEPSLDLHTRNTSKDCCAPVAGGGGGFPSEPTSMVTGDSFGSWCPSLEYVRLPSNLTKLGRDAFNGCGKLIEIDLSNCTQLKEVKVSGCEAPRLIVPSTVTVISVCRLPNLKELNLGLCGELTNLGEKLCFGCDRLSRVQLPSTTTRLPSLAFANTGPIPPSECGCSRCLVDLDLTASWIVDVGDSVCRLSRLLRTISLPTTVTTIGVYFCNSSYHLKVLDLTQCTHLISIGSGFGSFCPEMAEVRLPSSLRTIGDSFCDSCPELTTVTVSGDGLLRLSELGCNFCLGCPKLTTVQLCPRTTVEPPRNVTTATTDCGKSMSTSLVLGARFCEGSSRLALVELPPQTSSIGDYFCFRNKGPLALLDLSRCSQLTKVGDRCAAECPGLQEVRLPSSLKGVGSGFLQYCTALCRLDLSAIQLSDVGPGFGRGCSNLENIIIITHSDSSLPLLKESSGGDGDQETSSSHREVKQQQRHVEVQKEGGLEESGEEESYYYFTSLFHSHSSFSGPNQEKQQIKYVVQKKKKYWIEGEFVCHHHMFGKIIKYRIPERGGNVLPLYLIDENKMRV